MFVNLIKNNNNLQITIFFFDNTEDIYYIQINNIYETRSRVESEYFFYYYYY